MGKTGRSFATRKKEPIRNVKTTAKGCRIANHAWSHDHVIDFNNASITGKGSSRIRNGFWNPGTSPPHLMQTITLAHSQDNIAFLSTNFLMNYSLILLHCFLVLSHHICFRIFNLFIISPVEDCNSGSRKLVSFYILSQRTFFNFLTCFILVVAPRYFQTRFCSHVKSLKMLFKLSSEIIIIKTSLSNHFQCWWFKFFNCFYLVLNDH